MAYTLTEQFATLTEYLDSLTERWFTHSGLFRSRSYEDLFKEEKRLRKRAEAEEEEEEERKKQEAFALELGLETEIKLIGPFYIKRSAYERLSASFQSVVVPSLATKLYGRECILSGLISHATTAAFILTNLLFVAPEVALIAGIIRFTWVFIKDLYDGKPWEVALKNASKEALKTAVKFLIVYMVWTLAIVLGTKLGIMAGPLLPLGILLVAALTSLGFTFASFLVDKLPGYIAEPKRTWALFQTKLRELAGCLLPAANEGWTWTLLDNPVVNISGHVSGLGGKILDLGLISIIVSGAFFLGAVLHCSVGHWIASKKTPKKMEDSKTAGLVQDKVLALVEDSNKDNQSHYVVLRAFLAELKEKNINDPLLMDAVVQYAQYSIILSAMEKVLRNAASVQAENEVILTSQEKGWLGLTTTASAGQLDKIKRMERALMNRSSKANGSKTQQRAQGMKNDASKKLEASVTILKNRFGLFASGMNEGRVYSTDLRAVLNKSP